MGRIDGRRGLWRLGAMLLWAAGLAPVWPAAASPGLSAPASRLERVERKWRKLRRKSFRFLARRTEPVSNVMDRQLRAQLAMCFPSARHLPEALRERPHEDFAGPFRWVPRSWTSFQWGRPRMIVGRQANRLGRSPRPIGEPGSFQISRFPDLPAPFCWLPLYFSCTTGSGLHFRAGARWDDVDSYTQVPSIAIKKL